MRINRLPEILDMLDISHEQICESINIDEGDLYRVLSSSDYYDENIINKISKFLCIPPELLILPKDYNPEDTDLLLIPVFSSFRKPYYIFKLYALDDVKQRPLQNFLSFIPDGFKCTLTVTDKSMVLFCHNVSKTFIEEDVISFDSCLLENCCINLQKGSVVAITVEID